jgi:hypothetical protein
LREVGAIQLDIRSQSTQYAYDVSLLSSSLQII